MSEPKLGKLMDESMVKITANYGDGVVIAYNVPFNCRYFVAEQLVEMGAVAVQIGVPFIKTEELV